MRKAMARPNRPVASASAKPRKAKGVTCAAGLRASAVISAENTLPMPIPAPTSAMQAIPAPINFADAGSIMNSPEVEGAVEGSVKVDGVVQIEAGQDGEDIGLQHRDQDFEEDQQHVDAERDQAQQADHADEAAEDRQHGMACLLYTSPSPRDRQKSR